MSVSLVKSAPVTMSTRTDRPVFQPFPLGRTPDHLSPAHVARRLRESNDLRMLDIVLYHTFNA